MNEGRRLQVVLRPLLISTIVILLFLWLSPGADGASGESGSVREQLRRRIEAVGISPEFAVGDEAVFASVALPLFYERRAFEPAWVDQEGPTPLAKTLIASLERADREGLRPENYHFEHLNSLHLRTIDRPIGRSRQSIGGLVDLELLCTDAFLVYGSHLLSGVVNPQTIDAEWYANRRDADLAAVLETAVSLNAIDSVLNSLLPPQPGYRLLRSALARYRELQRKGGWVKIADGPTMKIGSDDQRVLTLRSRLAATGDFPNGASDSAVFDRELKEAVEHFQRRHGLEVDGSVGPATLAALNVSIGERLSQIIINLERWRWLPQELGRRHVLINIANFDLDIVEQDTVINSMRVIVGKPYRRTPVFSDRITYMVLNPYWNVPHFLAVRDVLPRVKTEPGYLAENDFELLQGWGEETQLVDPATVDWTSLEARPFPYRLRQKPGPKNALGRIKFMFPNQFNVYLHDTPERGLFAKVTRDFSSGCIRVEQPLDLALYLLCDHDRWTEGTLRVEMDKGAEQTVRLREPLPIHILYWTAWATPDGLIHFRKDVYERDRPLFEALQEEPPATD